MSEQNINTKTEPEWKKSPFIRFAMWVEYNDKFSDIADHERCLAYKNTMKCGVRCGNKIIELALIKEVDKFTFNIKHKESEISVSGDSFDKTFELFKQIVKVFCHD